MSEWKETEFGRIPGDWDLNTIDSIKSKQKHALAMGPFGSNITSDNFLESGVPVIRGNNLNSFKFIEQDFVFVSNEKADALHASICTSGDLVFTHRGTIGQVSLIPDKSCYERYIVSQSGMKLTADQQKMSSLFLFYFFKSKYGQYQLLKNESQVGVPSIGQPLTSLKEIEVPIPPLHEQKAIVGILGSIDDKIDLLQRNNKTLESMAETLFTQWFVEFQFITAEGLYYKQKGGSFYETEFGMIPVGWTTPKVSEIIEVKDGTHDSPKPTNNGYYLITSRHMKPQGLDFDNAYMISEEDYKGINKRSKVEQYDILISMIGTLGLLYYVQQPEINFAIKNIGLFKTSQEKEIAGFLYLFLKSCYGDSFLYSNTEGSTQEYIALGSLRNLKIIMPDRLTLRNFALIVDPILNKIHENAVQIRTLESLRDTLLPNLITGEIRVPV